MRSVKELNEEIAAKSKRLHWIFEEAGPDMDMAKIKSLEGDSAAKAAEIKRSNMELAELGRERDDRISLDGASKSAKSLHEFYNKPGERIILPGDAAEGKTLGGIFVASQEYKQFKGMRNWPAQLKADIELKDVFRTGAGWAPPQMRIPRIELSAQRPIAVVDHIPQLPTDSETIRYMKETTFTSTNIVEKAESTATTNSDLIGEAALVLTETTDEVETLPAFIPVTQQQMEDVAGIEAYINQRLAYMLQARLDLQIIQGTGVTPLLLGTNNVGSVLSQAKGSDPTPDAIYKGMRQVRATGFAEPSVVFAHPNDWEDIRLLRTADGIYIFGSPLEAGMERIWGVPVVVTTAALENTITLGDYARFSALYTKRGITLAVSDSHQSYFTRGMLAIRADTRVAMVHFRATAFCKITGV